MVLKSNISITQFLFTLEELLLENLVISHRRELEWHIVEYYKNIVIRDLPASFQLDKKQFLSFKKNYNQRRRIFEKYKQPGDLDPLKVLLRQARDAASCKHPADRCAAPDFTSSPTSQTGAPYQAVEQTRPRPPAEQPSGDAERPSGEVPLQAPFDVEKVCKLLGKLVDAVKAGAKHQEVADLKVELCDVKVELRDLKQVVLASVRNVAEPQAPCVEGVFQTPSAEAVKAVLTQDVKPSHGEDFPGAVGGEAAAAHPCRPGAAHQSVKAGAMPLTASASHLTHQVIQSVGSKRPFVRARQRVALCILYISGFTIANLQRLTVGHLKQLRQFAHGASAATLTAPFRLRVHPSEAIELVASLREELDILISDVSDETTAFRALSHSVSPCSRESLTKELNKRLGHFQLSTKSWRSHIRPRPNAAPKAECALHPGPSTS